MKVVYVFISLVVILAMIGGCGNVDAPTEASVVFTENGIELTSAHVYVSDYQQGKRADITFFITNNLGDVNKTIVISNNGTDNTTGLSANMTSNFEMTKVFNVTPENNSHLEGKGYVAVPAYYADWIKIPPIGDIAVGRSKRYTAVMEVPYNTPEKVPGKWAFVVVLASNTGGFTQVSCGVWIVVDMR